MSIGSTIKALRRAKNMTQEELAEYLGISPKAISQWECDRTAPDISQLAPLASIFEVSADHLLGIDVSSKAKQIEQLYDEAYCLAESGMHGDAVILLEKGLQLHPSAYSLMDLYANEIFLYNDTLPIDSRGDNQKRALAYLDKILNECTDQSIRNNCLSMACLWYPHIGRAEEAERLAKTLDGAMWTCGELLGKIYTGQQQFETLRDEMLRQFTSAIGELLQDVMTCCDDLGSPIYSEDEILQLHQMCINMLTLYFPDGDYYHHSRYAETAYRQMADIYAKRGDAQRTLECLHSAASLAIHFDTTPPDAVHTSPTVKGLVCGNVWWHDGHNSCYHLLDDLKNKSHSRFAFICSTDTYASIVEKLQAVAK
ncbi:MAG: helix-turn-helix transcriptional regulator [Clostridia bacterium]|nr:helix-turn-helix transcriptional regulator [Clostridia bacterium]